MLIVASLSYIMQNLMFVQALGDWMMLFCCYHTGDRFIVCTTGPQGDNHLLLYRYKQSSGKQVNLCMYGLNKHQRLEYTCGKGA